MHFQHTAVSLTVSFGYLAILLTYSFTNLFEHYFEYLGGVSIFCYSLMMMSLKKSLISLLSSLKVYIL